MGRLTPLDSALQPNPDLALYRQLYSELYHAVPGSTYGPGAAPATMLQSVLAEAQTNAGNVLYSSELWTHNQGSLAQRAAFLADTDYATFRARELAALNVQYQGRPAAQVAEAGSLIPSAGDYYLACSLLLQALAANGYSNVLAAVRPVLSMWTLRSVEVQQEQVPGRGWVVSQTARPQVPVSLSLAAGYLYQPYLWGMPSNRSRTVADYYGRDRYNQATLAYPYLQGWAAASAVQKALFADTLAPWVRVALLDSLATAALALRGAGAIATAEAARDTRGL